MSGNSGLRERILTALVLAPVGIAAVLMLPSWAFASFIAVLFLIGAFEWALLSGWRNAVGRLLVVVTHAIALYLVWIAGAWLQQQIVWIGCGFWFLAAWWLKHAGFGASTDSHWRWVKTAASLLAIVPAFAAAILLDAEAQGSWLVLFVLVLIWCADSFAYFSGRRFGKRKLAPTISPGKTTAGAYGALVGCTLYSALVAWFGFDLRGVAVPLFVLLCLVTVLFSIVGDLFESLFKRHAQVKDSGHLFPGHGGMLDRFDSIFAALPIFVAGRLFLAS